MKYPTSIHLIVATAENNVIGSGNKMLWHLPNDFKYFKNKTLHHSILMGRKTFESIGKALPERRNIVITKDYHYQGQAIDVANSFDEAMSYCRDEPQVFVIGGGQIYEQALPFAEKVFLTRVHTTINGEVKFPELSNEEWKLVSQDKHIKDEKHEYDYTFEEYVRI